MATLTELATEYIELEEAYRKIYQKYSKCQRNLMDRISRGSTVTIVVGDKAVVVDASYKGDLDGSVCITQVDR